MEKPVEKEVGIGWLSRMRVKECQRFPLLKMIDREYGVYKKDIGELKNHNTEIPCTVQKEKALTAGDAHRFFPAHTQRRGGLKYHMTPSP